MRAIVGTAGHIDHGKSALVRALTGIEPDRLPEERERGISIELGFAHLTTARGDRIGIVDVPGHERFIRQMLAGAQGFDYVLVVVAADDGVMPQTEEHFEICHLLGVERGAFVITKCDLASAARLEDVRTEIEMLAEGTAFATAPVLCTSTVSGAGIDELRAHLVEALQHVERAVSNGVPFRLPIDRAFVLKGRGVVVTGTATDGVVKPGDELVLLPANAKAKVREVQVHGTRVPDAHAGERVALNVSGVNASEVARGSWATSLAAAAPTTQLEARVEIRPSALRPLRSHEKVRLHLGTSESLARIIWLGGCGEVAPRASELAQLRLLDTSVVTLPGDRFVLRDETGQRTLGGGRVLLSHAPRRRRRDELTLKRLQALESEDAGVRVAAYLRLCSGLAIAPGEIARCLRLSEPEVESALGDGATTVTLRTSDNESLFAARERVDAYVETLVARVGAHHDRVSSAAGLEIETLRQDLSPVLELRLFRSILDTLCEHGRLERRGGLIAIPGHTVHMEAESERLAERVCADLRAAGSMPPSLGELAERYAAQASTLQMVVSVLIERGLAVKVNADLYFASESIVAIERKLRDFLEREGKIAPAGLRDLIDASRKYTIPLLDYFDRSGLTVRTGDYRRLR